MDSHGAGQGTAHHADDAAFSFVCLGVGGGPLETNCSGYLMKPADQKWSDGTTLLEAGTFSIVAVPD